MTAPIKPNREKRLDFQLDPSEYRVHYDDMAASIIPWITRHGWLIAVFVALALVIACILIPLLPRKYSAEALIYPNLVSREQSKVVALGNTDGASIVNGEALLIRSEALLRAVAKRLGQDPNVSGSWLKMHLDRFRAAWLPETRSYSPFDRTVAALRKRIVVTNETRSYLISISFTASSAEEAARVVNAVVAEYLRDKVRQRRQNKVVAAEAELRERLALYGEKHPKTLQAVDELEADRTSLEAAMNSQDDDQLEVADNQSVRLAVPNYTPTSPKGIMIFGLSILFGLLAGVGFAFWRDRRAPVRAVDDQPLGKDTDRKRTLVYHPHSR
ncbi:hypothetical protein JQ633_31440 [Bradyrhizobium tropiciagri]|nr:hypothetical protein [Bradyrhizobium tropiciagri]